VKDKVATRLAEIRAKGTQKRDAEVMGVDVEARTVELAFSSEAEVPRWYGLEVLSHDPGACNLARLNDSANALVNHSWDDVVGVIVEGSARIDDDRRGRCVVRFGKSARAEEIFQDVVDGIRKHVSVGYMIDGLKLVEERKSDDVFLVTAWTPHEISFATVPADTSVGVGRSLEIPPEEDAPAPSDTGITAATIPEERNQKTMTIKTVRNASGDLVRAEVDDAGNIVREIEVVQASTAGADTERARVRSITDLAGRFGRAIDNADALMRTALAEGHSAETFQRALLDAMDARSQKPLNDQAAGADIGMSEREARQFSLLRVVRALIDPTDRRAQDAARGEFEASAEAAKKAGKSGERFMIPTDVLRRSVYGDRAMNTGTGGAAAGDTGGFGVQTTLLTGSFIDILRNRATIMSLGRVLGGLVGNIDIPKQVSGATGYWLGEDDDATETGAELGQNSMSPKTVAGFTEFTRKLAMQSSLDVEAMLRADLAIGMALTLDKAGYYGTGTAHQPLGLANVTGINAVAFGAAGQPTFPELVAMETAIALDNADVNGMSYVANAGFRGHAKTTLKFAAAGSATLWEPGGQVNGYGCAITNQVNAGDVFFGNFADFIIALWGGLEITVDPYSNSKKGRLRLIGFQDVDFSARRVESFTLGR
jgi:HK97 family phage major capsid protein/HK97 family phage prohead protease